MTEKKTATRTASTSKTKDDSSDVREEIRVMRQEQAAANAAHAKAISDLKEENKELKAKIVVAGRASRQFLPVPKEFGSILDVCYAAHDKELLQNDDGTAIPLNTNLFVEDVEGEAFPRQASFAIMRKTVRDDDRVKDGKRTTISVFTPPQTYIRSTDMRTGKLQPGWQRVYENAEARAQRTAEFNATRAKNGGNGGGSNKSNT